MQYATQKAERHFRGAISNDPNKRGQKAHRPFFFGDEYSNNRFMLYPIHTRFDAIQWIIKDASVTDDVTGLSQIIRQIDSKDDAISEITTLQA